MTNHIILREFIEAQIAADNKRRDEIQLAYDRLMNERFVALDKALILQAASYPTTRDFNELKSTVEKSVSSVVGGSHAVMKFVAIINGAGFLLNLLIIIGTFLRRG